LFEEIISSIGDFTPALILGLGLMVGIEHAFESDHIAAVGTQLFKRKSKTNGKTNILKSTFTKSSLVGAFWGAGHTTTLVVIGCIAYFFTINIQPEIFSGFELMVGVMLIFLGITTVWKKKIKFQHRHPHQHSDGILHYDAHEHNDTDHKHGHKSYLIGLIHGLAGSGSLIALTAATLDSVEMAFTFILIFGIGSVIGMTIIGGLIGLPILLTNRAHFINRFVRYGSATVSLIIGANILFEIGILSNL
jgi:uncharacterized membrane protein YfcA